MKLLTHYIHALAQTYPEVRNWRCNSLNDSLFYSCRSTEYSRETYPSRLHYHDYYELVYFLEGDIHYVCGSSVIQPRSGDIILIPPCTPHMSVINTEHTRYSRHVFYLYPDALDGIGCGNLLAFLSAIGSGQFQFTVEAQTTRSLQMLLARLDEALKSGRDRDFSLAHGLIIEIFYLFNEMTLKPQTEQVRLPENVLAIQAYIDEHYDSILSVAEIASAFYYSREYVSRLFKRCFNTTVADYLTQRRIVQSQSLIASGLSLSEVCFRVGFGSITSFIRSFKRITHITPSQYREYATGHGQSNQT